MRLKRFKVTHFRSVMDSGWINCNDVTTLVGVNESGKSNILLALWKFNPARGGQIDPLHDLPVTELSTYEKTLDKISFIKCIFSLDSSAKTFSTEFGINFSESDEIEIERWFDEEYSWSFLKQEQQDKIEALEKSENDNSEEESEKHISHDSITQTILNEIPSFVYYSNYGNLASKIYLPHAVKWLNGEKITGVDVNEDQLRTIRVLFEYVQLEPDEILKYGKDAEDIARCNRNNAVPTKEEIQTAKDAKEKRSLLLQSAGTKLTTDFRDWWKQGEYKFRFQADGDYFQIWVSDSKRPEEVDLELRSTGLQWFLSFYLVFLVEGQGVNKDAVLLLDEAGLTLHPLAQRDLAAFFNKLSESNQIINTTHSPFIIDPENIDRCRVVYLDGAGHTVVSENLREGAGDAGNKSIYAVHAALGLTVSDVILQGCQVVIVEGISDQYYLSMMKNVLIHEGKIKPKQEIVFAPSGGVKGVAGIAGLVSTKKDELPFIILDSDASGTAARKKLLDGLYNECMDRVLEIKAFSGIEQSEIEDMIPYALMEKGVLRLFKELDDDDFEYKSGKPILPQIENYARNHNIELKTGWKVELAKTAKSQVLGKRKKEIDSEYMKKWAELFKKFM